MLASDVIADARHELNDEDKGMYRWSNERMLAYLFQALSDCQRYRPDAFLRDDGSIAAVTPPTFSSTLVLDETWRRALSFSVCAQALAVDGNDAANLKRATTYLEQFLSILIGGGG